MRDLDIFYSELLKSVVAEACICKIMWNINDKSCADVAKKLDDW